MKVSFITLKAKSYEYHFKRFNKEIKKFREK